jgi:hypothetical protein
MQCGSVQSRIQQAARPAQAAKLEAPQTKAHAARGVHAAHARPRSPDPDVGQKLDLRG